MYRLLPTEPVSSSHTSDAVASTACTMRRRLAGKRSEVAIDARSESPLPKMASVTVRMSRSSANSGGGGGGGAGGKFGGGLGGGAGDGETIITGGKAFGFTCADESVNKNMWTANANRPPDAIAANLPPNRPSAHLTSLSLAAVAMSDISALRPTNEAEERSKFLAALETGTSYEPQLKYVDAARAEKARASCDQHLSDEFAAAAASVLSGIIDDHGSEEQYQQNVWGRALEASEVDAMCDAYLNTNNLLGRVQFVWSPETLVTMFSGSTIKLVTRPGYYRELRLASLLDHEVGTHFIRTHNHKVVYSKQSERKAWSERATGWLIATEEGLATLNTHRLYSDKRFWIPALHYHAALLAAKLPFSELWAELSHC